MDHSGVDIDGDLPHPRLGSQARAPARGARARGAEALVRVIDDALPPSLVSAARRAISRLRDARFRESYFTTFWLDDAQPPRHALEQAVRALSRQARPRGTSGAEWWIGRSYTNAVPIGFHHDEDVRGRRKRHPRLSSVFFFNRV